MLSSISLIVLAVLLKEFWTFKLVYFYQVYQPGSYGTSLHKTSFRLYGKYSTKIQCMSLIWERHSCFIICLLQDKLVLKYRSLNIKVSNPFVFWGKLEVLWRVDLQKKRWKSSFFVAEDAFIPEHVFSHFAQK